MAKLAWDATNERFFEAGVDHGVLFPQNDQGGYNKGVAWNGLTSVSESPEGAEPNDLWADNIKYATLRSAETLSGTIEAYMCPDEFMECDGTFAVTKGVYIGQQPRKAFGFAFRSNIGNDTHPGIDAGYKLHLIYNATASPSEKTHETINDSPDAATLSWEFTTTPVDIEGHKPTASITIDTTKLDAAGQAALEELEALLYGTENTEPSLPSPAEVMAMFEPSGNGENDGEP